MNSSRDYRNKRFSQEGRTSTIEGATSSVVWGKRSRGRPLSKTMKMAIDLVHRHPNISPKELRRLLIGRGYSVSYGYTKKLKKRARRFLSPIGKSVPSNFVPSSEGEAIRVKLPEKPKMGLTLAFQEGSTSQDAQAVNGIGTEFTTNKF